MATGLPEHDRHWAQFLSSESCPPILGLSPLSVADADAVSGLVRDHLATAGPASPLQTLLRLMRLHPGIMTVWLARKAGEAYELGTFWELFEGKLGILVSPNDRPRFASEFRQTCRRVMSHYVEPTAVGSFKYVETFLFQAGLPLCFCQHFANALRDVERRYGLPDPDFTEAGDELQESLGTCMRHAPPNLRRAVQGPAGPLICLAALRVLLEVDNADINPALRDALETAFANQRGAQLRRSARTPHLRISSDLGSLEIVGPKQDAGLIIPGCLVWKVNEAKHPTAHWDEFVMPVGKEARLSVELLGLRGGLDVSRTFNLRLDDREQPFMVFDFASRKQRRVEIAPLISLKSGAYWVLHPVAYKLTPATIRYEWLDGGHAVSLLQLRPGIEAQLAGTATWTFKADRSPFCEFATQALTTDDGERICYGATGKVNVWIPAEAAGTQWGNWSLEMAAGENRHSWPLVSGEATADMVLYQPDILQFLNNLAPGLHQLQIVVARGRKSEFARQYWFWASLENYDEGRVFRPIAMPKNLVRHECHGFTVAGNSITHRRTDSPRHALAFDVDGNIKTFHWSQTGIYLESLEKRAGQAVQVQFHQLRERFSASIDSHRFLRIWQIPASEAELVVNARQVQFIPAGSERPFVEVSLADLSTKFPNGGTISLRRYGQETVIAKFSRPLTPTEISLKSKDGYRCLGLTFLDQVRWVKPRLRELVSGRVIEYSGSEFDSSGHCIFAAEQLPAIECSNVSETWVNWQEGLEAFANQVTHDTTNDAGHAITVNVPKEGWPPGLWLIEFEARRDETSDWQLVTTDKGKLVPVLVAGPREETNAPRHRAFWTAYENRGDVAAASSSLADLAMNPADLFDLLGDVSQLVERGFAKEVQHKFAWLEHLFHELGRLTGKTLNTADSKSTTKLLNLACIETNHGDADVVSQRSLFVTVPELLALPTSHYTGISAAHPLAESLRWCARLVTRDSVFDAFRDLVADAYANPHAPVPDMVRVVQCFGNFIPIVQAAAVEGSADDLAQFNYSRYLQQIVGPLQEAQPQAEWDERTALSRAHVEWALSKLVERRQAGSANLALGAVNALLSKAPAFRNWLRQNLSRHTDLMPVQAWAQPWPAVAFENDNLIENCSRFASMFALAARASGAEWLRFEDVIQWLTVGGVLHHSDDATIATLVGMAPELFGYYLMFWELMIRTCPHD